MSKKTNTIFFILIATFFNVLVTVSCFLFLLILYSKFLYPLLPESLSSWIMPIFFIASIIISFLFYRAALKIFMKKVDVEKHFDSILGPRKPHIKH